MGRGKSLKTKIKEAASLSIPLLLAEKQASMDAENKKPWDVKFKEYLGQFIKNIGADDIIKLSGWLTLTIIIKPILQGTALIPARIIEIAQGPLFPAVIAPGGIGLWVISHLFPGISKLEDVVSEGTISLVEKNELAWWILALCVSSLIILFGPAILESVGGIAKLGLLLIT